MISFLLERKKYKNDSSEGEILLENMQIMLKNTEILYFFFVGNRKKTSYNKRKDKRIGVQNGRYNVADC